MRRNVTKPNRCVRCIPRTTRTTENYGQSTAQAGFAGYGRGGKGRRGTRVGAQVLHLMAVCVDFTERDTADSLASKKL